MEARSWLDDKSVLAIAAPLLSLFFTFVPWDRGYSPDPSLAEVQRLLHVREKGNEEKEELIRLLKQVNVNRVIEGRPLFIRALIDEKQLWLLPLLREQGADLNAANWGSTLFLEALNVDIQREVTEANTDGYGFYSSDGKKTLDDVEEKLRVWRFTREVLNGGANPNILPRIDRKPGRQIDRLLSVVQKIARGEMTPIQFALQRKRHLLAASLVTNGAHLDKKSARDTLQFLMTKDVFALDEDVSWDKLIPVLVAAGIDLNALLSKNRESTSEPPITVALKQKNITLLKALLKAGANPDTRSERGALPLAEALDLCRSLPPYLIYGEQYDRRQHMQEWITKNEEANKENESVYRIVELLITFGANANSPPNTLNGHSESLLQLSVEKCSSNVVELLVSRGKAVVDRPSIQRSLGPLAEYLYRHADEALRQ